MKISKTVAVDFDGTLCEYYQWKGVYQLGRPLDGAKDFLQALRNKGYRILIYSCRTNSQKVARMIESHLNEHEMLYDEVFVEGHKPEATAYFDDRAISVQPQKNGKVDYTKAIADLEDLVEWKKKEKTMDFDYSELYLSPEAAEDLRNWPQ